MKNIIAGLFFVALISSSCVEKKDTSVVSAFDVYCEMVANDAKPLALHYPMENEAVDEHWNEFQEIAGKHQVELYREDDFPVSLLFPASATEGKSVMLIYRGNRLKQYEQWKTDVKASVDEKREKQEGLARRFGRLLGYSPQGINQLLSQNSDYRNISSFSVKLQITHLYYEDVNAAINFYQNVLGLTLVDSATFQLSGFTNLQLHPFNADHPKGQTKSVAVALLTGQLAAWYEHLQTENIPIKYTYKSKEGGPHDGFVAIDPGGYLLGFELFKQHPENELFVAALARLSAQETVIKGLSFHSSITWTYHNDLLKMQQFYEDVLGCQMVADQGWTKIYQTSAGSFIGLVDERRGMEDYADTKAVEIEWTLASEDSFDTFAQQYLSSYEYKNNSFQGPEKYIYRLSFSGD